MNKSPILTGIVGLGRSGYNIHAKSLSTIPSDYKITAVCDPIKARTQEAADKIGCSPYDSIEELLQHPDLELVVVASPNPYHTEHALAALKAGKHVVCEKPFGFNTKDVDQMLAASRKAGVLIQPFQQRRYEQDFQKVKEICESGVLGQITFIRICWHTFGRRWDWQTTTSMGGGQLNNNGPHLIDHAMELFGASEPEVWCSTRNSLSSGDAEDEFHLILKGNGAPTIQAEILSTAGYPQDRWFVCGTAGSLRGTAKQLAWKHVDWSKMDKKPLQLESTADRSYNREKLNWVEGSWESETITGGGAGAQPDHFPIMQFYRDLWSSIREGAPQVITPESVRRRIAVLEKCHQLNGLPCGVPSQGKTSKTNEVCHV